MQRNDEEVRHGQNIIQKDCRSTKKKKDSLKQFLYYTYNVSNFIMVHYQNLSSTISIDKKYMTSQLFVIVVLSTEEITSSVSNYYNTLILLSLSKKVW